jgi:hypothetical protein
MGKDYKKNVELVISHIEGCSGNFLGRIYANRELGNEKTFRVDHNLHTDVLATGDKDNLINLLEHRFKNHRVIVTHCQDLETLQELFPAAKILSIYPYSHIGNVLYNISIKKLKITLSNAVDNHWLHINEWFNSIVSRKPVDVCIDFWDLTDKKKVQDMLGIELDTDQDKFFDQYWASQLQYELDLPTDPMTVDQLVHYWNINDFFCPWTVAWTIFVYEKIHNLKEGSRLWSIDQPFNSWQDVASVESRYDKLI